MPITENTDEDWTGSRSRLVKPIGEVDCELAPTFEALCRQEAETGRGCTVRGGVGFAKRTVAEITSTCTPATPSISNVTPDPLFEGEAWSVLGSGFYDEGGTVYLGNASSWAACTIKVPQAEGVWGGAQIDLTAVGWGIVPANVWVYVLNKYGKVNAAGYARQIVGPP